ncbi:MAG: S1 RNA-binding domain-containing protein [Myxococcales bacterium]|nr:S1 RNA-binding domain-containing protein [Myxococcales bacterium]MDH3484333.1 S1 RNA-binding domain-containing protein [Myxococcales bacterium]
MTETDSKTSETSSEEAAPVESQSAPPSAEAAPDSGPDVAVDAESTGGDPAPDTETTETASGEVAAETGTETASGEVAAETGTESSSGEVPAEGGKKKRRRRRKKKGAQAGTTDAPSEGKAGHHHAPFLHLFSGGGARKHAFSVGEVIAGRVERIDQGVIVVDLFGKASAIADADEPREIPLIIHAATEERRSVVPHLELAAETALPDTDTTAPVPTPATEPSAEIPAPAAAKNVWRAAVPPVSEFPELGEADTVVGAQAYAEADTAVGAQAYVEADTAVAAKAYEPTVPPEAPVAPEGEGEASGEKSGESSAEPSPAPEAPAEAAPVQEDLSDADLSLLEPLPELGPPEMGAIFRGRIGAIAESGHIAIVNRDIDKAAVRKAIRAARQDHQRVNGVVYGFNRGGFDVLVGGVRAFCPASAMSLTPIDDPSAFVGQRCEFSLPQDKGGKKSIIVSRRNILEKEARKRARERMGELEVGAKLRGKVLEVRDYGVLVDLGDGLDGLVHMSEISWSRGLRPNQAAQVGDEVDVQVVKVQPATRKDRFGRVSLSMRACQPDPWDIAKDTLRPGVPVKGKVMRTTEFGAFVQIQENIEGLLHISELGGSKELTHAKQAVQEGDEIDVVIERVDREQRRISLSRLSEADAKAIEAGEIEFGKAPRSLKAGSHVSVVVKRVEHSGAQVQVDGVLGKRGRGFIPNRELQDIRGERRKGPAQGDVIEVKVIGTERDGTLRCSIRARLLDEERRAVKEYRKESAKQGLGTFGDLLKAKLEDSSE